MSQFAARHHRKSCRSLSGLGGYKADMSTDSIYEFRDYTLRPGQRDTLISLFEREFIKPQEALGAHVRALFRDIDRPDRFVWIRSFTDAASRFAALDGFYSGPAWQTHRGAANSTMIDSDNVMQLRPIGGTLDAKARPDREETEASHSIFVSTAYSLSPGAERDFVTRFQRDIIPNLGEAAPFATFITDQTPNSYPRLPIRQDETVFLTLSRADNVADPTGKAVAGELGSLLIGSPEIRRLQPTARSALR